MQKGTLIEWDDDRGFGFIRSDGPDGKIFVHISAFETGRRPQRGERLSFATGIGRDGKAAARQAWVEGISGEQRPNHPSHFDRNDYRVWAAAGLLVLVFVSIVLDRAPFWLIVPYAIMGGASWLAYWMDKQAAIAGRWRISEAGLHGLDAVFGIIGGLLAQQVFRHKTSKPGFAFTTGGIAFLHGLVLVGMASGALSYAELLTLFE
jgi:uncharacterized membrane protein YsdA (DUF1294 family)/cold shock CspA family protein